MTELEMNKFKDMLIDEQAKLSPQINPRLNDNQLKNIVIHSSNHTTQILEDFFNPLGLTLKEECYVKYFNERLQGKQTTVKLYDIIINIDSIDKSLEIVKKDFTTIIDRETAIKSIITHEFMHAISHGYVLYPEDDKRNNKDKDESHTDYLAKKLFNKCCSDRTYFTTYDFPKTDGYEKEMSAITENSIRTYFLGD